MDPRLKRIFVELAENGEGAALACAVALNAELRAKRQKIGAKRATRNAVVALFAPLAGHVVSAFSAEREVWLPDWALNAQYPPEAEGDARVLIEPDDAARILVMFKAGYGSLSDEDMHPDDFALVRRLRRLADHKQTAGSYSRHVIIEHPDGYTAALVPKDDDETQASLVELFVNCDVPETDP